MKTTTKLIAGMLVFAFSAQAVQATVIYREVFGSTAVTELDNTNIDWNANFVGSDGSTLYGTTNTNTYTYFGVEQVEGRPNNLPNVNAGNVELSQVNSYGYRLASVNNPNGHRSMVWTEEYTVDRSSWQIDTISFYSNNSSTPGVSQLALRVDSLNTPGDLTDDVWVVSSDIFSSTGGTAANWPSHGVLHTLNFGTATWKSLTFNPLYGSGTGSGSDLSAPGSSVAFPSGNITAFGLYIPPSNSVIRFDTYQIDAHPVPEPASVSLLLMGSLFFVRLRRKR